jgi:hypothetical protein
LIFFSNDEVHLGHHLHATVAFGGVDFLQGRGSYSIEVAPTVRAELLGEGGTRPDRVFSGEGWDTSADRYRYRETGFDVRLRLRTEDFWRHSHVRVSAGVDGHELRSDGYAVLSDNSPSLAEGMAQGLIAAPEGIDDTYYATRTRVDVAIDTREREPAPGHGVRLEAHGEYAFDLEDPYGRNWVLYGGGIGAYLDLGAHRVFGLTQIFEFSDPLGTRDQPFTELVSLGEDAPMMQGFLRGQLRGRSATVMTLDYVYPVWTRLDGRLHVAVGNAFDAHLRDFALERLRLSWGLGLSSSGDPGHAYEVAVAFGTGPFERGSGIESVRLHFGSRAAF